MSEIEIIESLKKLMSQVRRKQRELSRIILEKSKGKLSPSLIQLTDPKMLDQEKKLISLVEKGTSDSSFEFRDAFRELVQRCEMKNKMVTGLLDDLKNNFDWKSVASCSSEEDGLKAGRNPAKRSDGNSNVGIKKRKPKGISPENLPLGNCPDCKIKIKPRKLCKKCGQVDDPDEKHFLKCVDCGHEVVERNACPKCCAIQRRKGFFSCRSSESSLKNESTVENFATLAVPHFSFDSFSSFSDKDLKFLREPRERFEPAAEEDASFYEFLPEYEDPSEESFLAIKMQEEKKFRDDENAIEALGSSLVKLSDEIKENLADLMARSRVDGEDHPRARSGSSPKVPSEPDEVNEDFDVEVYDRVEDENGDDDDEDYKSAGEIPDGIKELIKNVTEYERLQQIPPSESDSELFHETEGPCESDGEEAFQEFEESFPHVTGLDVVSIPSSVSFQTALRLIVENNGPKKSCVVTPLHSVGKLISIRRVRTASSVNLSLNDSRSHACILLFVTQNFRIPFVEISEAPKKIMKHPKKFASLVIARAETLNSSRAVSVIEATPSTRIEIRDESTKIEIKKLISPNQAAVFETEKALIFAGIEFEEKWPSVSVVNPDEEENVDFYLDARDFPFPDELFGASKGLETAPRESDDDVFDSAVDVVRKIQPKAKAQKEIPRPVPVLDESEERLDKLLKLLSQLEKAIKESKMETESSSAVRLVKEIGESVETLEKTFSDISRVERIFESDSAEILRSDSDQKLKNDVRQGLINTKKSKFQELESEASEMEKRVEKDFDRIDRLIRQNDESIKFVEAFFEKTTRRAFELEELKREISYLQREQEILIEKLENSKSYFETENFDESTEFETSDVGLTTSKVISNGYQSTTVKDTISILMDDLDKLKNKAKEKNERCKEIFGQGFVLSKQAKPLTGLEKTKSSFTMKRPSTSIIEFKNVGFNSYYLSWSKPEEPMADSILGYEILVNGKINQKVRNPNRLQTVLYTVDDDEKTEVKLYGLTKIGLMLLGEITHLN